MTDLFYLRGTPKELKPVILNIIAMNQVLDSRDVGTIYGEPSMDFQTRRKFKPQVELFFKEDEDDVLPGYRPVEGRVSFRIMGEEFNTISSAELTNLARRIKEVFGANNGYIWRKGKELYSYTDPERGYGLKILSRSSEQARDLATKTLSIQNHAFVLRNMQLSKNEDELNAFPYEPPTQIILGEQNKAPRYRPNVEVRFHYAVAHIHGLVNPKLLYSRTRRRSQALVV